tara:strand:- start:280 stop:522 length:243 start_codon:yes stop_codon:yes gene_type:complete
MKLLKTNKNITLNTIEKNLIFDLVNIEIKKCIPFIEDDYKNKLIKIKNKMKLSKKQNKISNTMYNTVELAYYPYEKIKGL